MSKQQNKSNSTLDVKTNVAGKRISKELDASNSYKKTGAKPSGKPGMTLSTQKKFQEYYMTFRLDMYWYIRKKVNNDALAEDLTSDLFMKLFENSNIIKDRKSGGVKAWLYTVARNMVIDYLRKNTIKGQGDRNVVMEEEIFEIVSKEEGEYLEQEIKDQKVLLLNASLEILSSVEKELITLRFKEELRFKEIADVVGKEEGAVKMQIYRALEKLKKHLGDRI